MIAAKAYAKINWALDILATLENGYHEMDMLMQSISLHDSLTFEVADGLDLITNGAPDPYADRNLVIRAARLLQEETGCKMGARITLQKRIPAMAGLGGGSADCAAALRALNQMWALGLGEGRLLELGFSLGADVPFCLTGGLQRVGGLGERLRPLTPAGRPEMVLVMPDGGLSTRDVFQRYDRMKPPSPIRMQESEEALVRGDYRELDRHAGNVLAGPAIQMNGAVFAAIDRMYDMNAVMARMSGSGPAVFGVFRSAEAAQSACERLSGEFLFCKRVTAAPCGVELETDA